MAAGRRPKRFLWLRTLQGIQALFLPDASVLVSSPVHGPEDQHFQVSRTPLSSDRFPSPVRCPMCVPSLTGFRRQCSPPKPTPMP